MDISNIANTTTKYGISYYGKKNKFVDDELLSEVRNIELDILSFFKRVCDSNNLKYMMMYGSLLGVIRNDSMIPGDDDIDVAMPRADYDKLLKLAENKDIFHFPYFLQTPSNDECFFGGYCKLRRGDTSAIHPQNWWVNCNEGISIDIFPLDFGYSNPRKERKKRKKIRFFQRMLYAKNYGYFRDFKDMSMIKWKSYKYLSKLFAKNNLIDRLDAALREADYSGLDVYFKADKKERLNTPFGVYVHYKNDGIGRFFSAEGFLELKDAMFENIEVKIPSGWDEVLYSLYGRGYLMPAFDGCNRKYHGFYSASVSYEAYKKRFKGLCNPFPNKNVRVLLVGNSVLIDSFIDRYRLVNEIVRINFDSDIALADSLSREYVDSDYVVICAYDVRQYERIAQDAGIREYFIYWKNRDWMLLDSISE